MPLRRGVIKIVQKWLHRLEDVNKPVRKVIGAYRLI
jgi:hypothetical protein